MDSQMLGWLLVGAGVVLSLVGRHLFWLAVGIVGFLLTSSLVRAVLPDLDPTVVTVLSVAVGAAGAIVTVRSLRLVAAIAAALLLAAVGRALFVLYVDDSAWQWLVFGVAGAFGWLLVRALFDVGIVVTTALGGGWYVASGLGATDVDLASSTTLWIGLGTALVGMLVQSGALRRSKKPAGSGKPST